MHKLQIFALESFMAAQTALGAEEGLAYELAASMQNEAQSNESGALTNLPVLKQALLDYVMEQASARYLVAPAWDHIFPGHRKEIVRFAFDRVELKIAAMQVLGESGQWSRASSTDCNDVEISMHQGNQDALDNPECYGISEEKTIPTEMLSDTN